MPAKEEPQEVISRLANTDFKTHWLRSDLTTELKGTKNEPISAQHMGDELAQAADAFAALVIDNPHLLSGAQAVKDVLKVSLVLERTGTTLRDRKMKDRLHSVANDLRVFVLEGAHDMGLVDGVGEFLKSMQPDAREELLTKTYLDDVTAAERHLSGNEPSLRHWCLVCLLANPFSVVSDRGFFPSEEVTGQLTVLDFFEMLNEVRRLEEEIDYVYLDELSLGLDEMQQLVEIISGIKPDLKLRDLTRQFGRIKRLADDFPHLAADVRFHFPLLKLTRMAHVRGNTQVTQHEENLKNLADLRQQLLDLLVDPFVLESIEALSDLMTEEEIQRILGARYGETLAFLNVDIGSKILAPSVLDYCLKHGFVQSKKGKGEDSLFLSSDVLEVLDPEGVKALLDLAKNSGELASPQ